MASLSLDPISALVSAGEFLIDRFFPDPQKAQEARLELARMAQTGELAHLDATKAIALGQLEINKAEAAHGSLFVAGWRPYIGWVCGAGITYEFIARPLLVWLSLNLGLLQPPALDTGELVGLVLSMLGVGGLRTVERLRGAARHTLKKAAP